MSWGRIVRRNMLADLTEGLEFDSEAIETGGFTFSDGRSVGLIRDSGGGLRFLDSRRKGAVESIEAAGRTYIPPALNASLLEVLTLPTGRVSCGSTTDLFNKIHALFLGNGIPDESARLFAYFAISTWFLDVLPIAPFLKIIGSRPEAHLALQLLGSVVHHGIRLADLNLAGFHSLPLYIQLTLLMEHIPQSLNRILSASTYPDAYILLREGLTDLCCAKAVYAGTTLTDGFAGEPILRINLAPRREKLPVIDSATQQAIAAEFQPRLLDYRLTYAGRVRGSDFDVPGFLPDLRIVAQSLAACIVDAPEMQAAIAPLLGGQQEFMRSNRWVDPHCVALEALLNRCHGFPVSRRLGIGEIAGTATAILAERGETTKLEPKLIGNFLRMLGLSPKRDSQGYAVFLTDAVRRQIHRLAHDNEIEAVSQAGTNCVQCAEIIGVNGGSGITST